MHSTFQSAISFTKGMKDKLGSAWKSTNAFPGRDMFTNACSNDMECGKCGKKDTAGNAVTCSAFSAAPKDANTNCSFCTNDGAECCNFDPLPNIPNGQAWNDRSSGLKNVVDDWIAGDDLRDAVIAKYGNIEDWNMSGVTSLNALFYGKKTFNANLSEVRNFFSSLWCIYMDD